MSEGRAQEKQAQQVVRAGSFGRKEDEDPMQRGAKVIKGSHPLVRKPRPVQDRFIFSRIYCCYLLVFHVLPRYLYHFLKRPYCQDIPEMDYEFSLQSIKHPRAGQSHRDGPTKMKRYVRTRRHRRKRPADALSKPPHTLDTIGLQTRAIRAVYDGISSLALDGYVELTGAKLVPGSGQIAFFALEFARSLDAYLDKHLLAGTPLPMNTVLEVPEITEHIATFYRHVEPSGSAIPILKHLRQLFLTYYDVYVKAFLVARKSLQFEDILEVAKIDTGIWSRTIMEVVCIFNGHQIDYAILNDFYFFGMVAKFADDLFDLVSDVEQGLPNLLYPLVRHHPQEYTHLELAIKKGKRPTLAWWKKHCPLTCTYYFKHIEHYYRQIRSSKVRRLSLLMFVSPSFIIYSLD